MEGGLGLLIRCLRIALVGSVPAGMEAILSDEPKTYAGCRAGLFRSRPPRHVWGTWETVDKPAEGPGLAIIQKRRCVACGFEQWHRQVVFL